VVTVRYVSTTGRLQQVELEARSLLNARIEVVRALARTRQAVTDAKTHLALAERADAQAYAEAERAGWTPDELRRIGLPPPARRRPGRPRGQSPENSGNSTASG
jgi:hypothetical protein